MPSRTPGGLLEWAIRRFNEWLSSPWGFVQICLMAAAWTVLVALGIDKHGYVYLYAAGTFAFITQFNLAIFSDRAIRAAQAADARAELALQGIADLLERLHTADENDAAILEALRVSLQNQEHLLEAIIDLSQREVSLGEGLRSMVGHLAEIATTGARQHAENTAVLAKLLSQTEGIEKSAIRRGRLKGPLTSDATGTTPA